MEEFALLDSLGQSSAALRVLRSLIASTPSIVPAGALAPVDEQDPAVSRRDAASSKVADSLSDTAESLHWRSTTRTTSSSNTQASSDSSSESPAYTSERESLVAVYADYASLVYAGLLPSLLSFDAWLLLDCEDVVRVVLRQWLSDSALPLTELCVQWLAASFSLSKQRAQAVAAMRSLRGSVFNSKLNAIAGTKATERGSSSWPEALISVLVEVLAEDRSLGLLEAVADLANAAFAPSVHTASKPTLIGELPDLVRLVTSACLAFDDTEQGLEAMWRLVVTTPAALSEPGLERAFSLLDDIQQALIACDILKEYSLAPPLSLLLAAAPPGQSLCTARELATVKDLLGGFAFLYMNGEALTNVNANVQTKIDENEAYSRRGANLQEALVLAMSLRVGRTSGDGAADALARLLVDVAELRQLRVFGSLTGLWTGLTALKTALFLWPSTLACQLVSALLLEAEEESDATADEDRAASPAGCMSSAVRGLRELGVTDPMVRAVVLERARECFDSAASCYDKAMQDGRALLLLASLASSDSPDMRLELAYFAFASLLIQLRLDAIPLQIKRSSPAQALRMALDQLPSAYLNVDGEQIDASAEEPEMEQFLRREAPLPGQTLVDAALAMGDGSDETLAQLLVALASFSLKLGDSAGTSAIVLRLAPLMPVLSELLLVDALETCEVALGLMDVMDPEQAALRREMAAAFLCYCPEHLVSRYAATLRPDAQVSDDERHLELAQNAILKLFGILLTDRSDASLLQTNVSTPEEVVRTANLSTVRSEIVGHLSCVRDRAVAQAMLERRMQELHRKMITSASMASSGVQDSRLVCDEDLVMHLVGMGFHRNGAMRAAAAVKNNKTRAVAWAIEHSADADFAQPLADANAMLLTAPSGMVCRTESLEACFEEIKLAMDCLGWGDSNDDAVDDAVDDSALDTSVQSHSDDRTDAVELEGSVEMSMEGGTDALPPDAMLSSVSASGILTNGMDDEPPTAADSTDAAPDPSDSRPSATPNVPKSENVVSNVASKAMSKVSSYIKVQAAVDVAEDFTSVLASNGIAVAHFSEALCSYSADTSDTVIPTLKTLLIALATSADESALAFVPALLSVLSPAVLKAMRPHLELPACDTDVPEMLELPIASAASLELRIVWWLQLHRLSHILRSDDDDGRAEALERDCEAIGAQLGKNPKKALGVLARLYRDTSGSALLGLEQLKKLSVALLKHSSAEAAAALSKRLLDDVAALRRVSRAAEGARQAVDAKLLVKSETLFPDPSPAAESMARIKGAEELNKVLGVDNALAWSRAIGRQLELPPSELLLRAAYMDACRGQNDVSEVCGGITGCLSRMRSEHATVLCSMLCGLGPDDPLVRLQASTRLCLTCDDATLLLDAMDEAVVAIETKLARSGVQSSGASGWTVAEAASVRTHIARLSLWVAALRCVTPNMSAALRSYYDRPTALHEYLATVLLDSDVDVSMVQPLLTCLQRVAADATLDISSIAFDACISLSRSIEKTASPVWTPMDVQRAASLFLMRVSCVLGEETLGVLCSALNSAVTSDSNDRALLERRLACANVVAEYDSSDSGAVRLLHTRLVLLDFPHTRLGADVRTRGLAGSSDDASIDIDSEEGREQLLSALLEGAACFSATEFSGVVRLLRVWQVSAWRSVVDCVGGWTDRLVHRWGGRMHCRKSTDSAMRCFERVLQCMQRWDAHSFVLDLLLVDADLLNWAAAEDGSRGNSTLANPERLREWTVWLPAPTRLHVALALGGAAAEEAFLSAGDELDQVALLLCPLTLSSSCLISSSHWPRIARSYLTRASHRIREPASSTDYLAAMRDWEDPSASVLALLLASDGPACPLLPLLLSPLALVGSLAAEGHVADAVFVYWVASLRPVAGFDTVAGLSFISRSLETSQPHFHLQSVPECACQDFGWSALSEVEAFLLTKVSRANR